MRLAGSSTSMWEREMNRKYLLEKLKRTNPFGKIRNWPRFEGNIKLGR
jgi:hypothetical protein